MDRPLSLLLALNWETVAWFALLVVTVVARFYGLGDRAMSHDESLHSIYSLDLYREGVFRHNPMMHGPWLFHFNAFIYFLFGVSDAVARVGPALAGTGVVWMAWLFRRYIGRAGALAAAVLLSISPSLLFHSRYIRNDIYMALWAMIWVYGLFRYLDSRQQRWLYLTVTGMAFGFITKENQFMTGTLFGVFVAGLALWRAWRREEELRHSPGADLAVLMLTLVLPFTTPFGHLLFGWNPMAYATSQDLMRSGGLVAAVTLISVGLAYVWYDMRPQAGDGGDGQRGGPPLMTFRNWVGLMLFFWVIQIVFFTTFFTNPVNGLATGIVGSLGYWLAQQEVARGSQPWYYYILLGGLYEFLPMLLSLGGMVAVVRGLSRPGWDAVENSDLPQGVRASPAEVPARAAGRSAACSQPSVIRTYFVVFLLWWAASTWAAYSVAGEKMPWLVTHIAQPMALFGGWWLGRLLHAVGWSRARRTQTIWLPVMVPAIVFVLYVLLGAKPFQGRGTEDLAGTARWLFALVAGGGVLYLAWYGVQSAGRQQGVHLMAVGVAAVLVLLTVRFSYMLTYINYDYVNEYLVYAHGSPDIKRALREVDIISERTAGDRNIVVAYDDDTAWPMSWYMRSYPNAIFYADNPSIGNAMSASVIFVGSKNYGKVEPYAVRDYVSRTYRLIWWPEEDYKNLTWDRIRGALTDPEWRSRLWQIFFYRRHPHLKLSEWPNRHEFRMYVRRDLAWQVWDLNVTPVALTAQGAAAPIEYNEISLTALAIYAGVYEGKPLLSPRAVAVAADGSRVIADSGNNRIVVLDRNGNLVRAFGSTCVLSNPEESGCIDPDGDGPLGLGDGQFQEPWGVVVDGQGRIYVADTWNGRIQVFDAEGRFLRKWGVFAAANIDAGDAYSLFGPRGLAIDPDGNLLVADTGNKRILRYTPDGELIQQVGGGGFIAGRFEEPVSVAVDPRDGGIFVADAWNQRLQKLDTNLAPVAEWPVPSWESQQIYDKPYVAVDANGTVYASDPQFFQVFVYDSTGKLQGSFGRYGTDVNHLGKPNGLAVDPGEGTLLVADADNNRVMVFPWVQ